MYMATNPIPSCRIFHRQCRNQRETNIKHGECNEFHRTVLYSLAILGLLYTGYPMNDARSPF